MLWYNDKIDKVSLKYIDDYENHQELDINGKIIEIGGASDIHTYDVQGTFKNLILTARSSRKLSEKLKLIMLR